MLRLLSIRNFVVVEALELELPASFTVLTGETGAGKSILLDALALLLGDRFELRQLRAGTDRAELAAVFDTGEHPTITAWLAAHDLGAAEGEVLLRRTLDAQAHFGLVEGERVTVRRAQHAARFLHPEDHDYFAMLREKLHWSETPERLRGR